MTVPPPVSLEHGSSQDNPVSLNVIANLLLLYTLVFLYYYGHAFIHLETS